MEQLLSLRKDVDEDGRPIAQDEIYELTEMMREAFAASEPRVLKDGEWHLPFVNTNYIDWSDEAAVDTAIKSSVARCARVSYLTVEGKEPNVIDDLKLYERLVGAHPIHASPAEHQATPTSGDSRWVGGNFKEWIQYRKTLPGESGEI
jgi:hypothetical protein